jgi:sulfatase maturation enzyme AslB (radical SAM superfamily)
MNPSRYNLFFKAKDGRYLLVNTLTRSKVFVDDELKNVIESGVFDQVDPHIVEQLSTLGVITTTDELQKFTALYKKRVFMPFEYEFTIIPTYQCNLNCYYCDHSEKTLSREAFEKFKEFFSKELEKGEFENVAIRIAGGEPLLYPELLINLLKELAAITHEYGKKFFSAIATNGTLLTPALLDELSFLNAIQLTVEGCRAYHDTVRYDTEGTYDRVLTSAAMIKDAHIFLNMRVHVSKESIPGLKELFNELKSLGVGKEPTIMITAAPVIPTKMCPIYPLRCTEMDDISNVLPKAWKAAKECGLMITGIPSPVYERLPCPYVTPTSVIVDPAGAFYTCLRELEGNASLSHASEIEWQKECKPCSLLPVCGGCRWNTPQSDCAIRSVLTNRLKFSLKNEHPILE